MKVILALLALSSVALANVDYTSTDSHFTYTPASEWDVIGYYGSEGCGTEFFMADSAATVTFVFPVASTFFQWYGYQKLNGGKATVCVDNAPASSCQTVSFWNATVGDTDPPRMLFQQTGLSNATHTVTITSIIDPMINDYGQLTMDHITLAGTVSVAPSTPPVFPAGTFVSSVPINSNWMAPISLGGHSPALNFLFDTGASTAWADWTGCTDADCSNHNRYVPSASMYNFSITDETAYANENPFEEWRVNDTFTFGNISSIATFGAAYEVPVPQVQDGNWGMAKAFYIAGKCEKYANFVEAAHSNGKIKAPVLAFYQLSSTDKPASGVVSVVQVGGVDKNKYTGSIDWLPMTQDSWWISPSQVRTVKKTSTSAAITPSFTSSTIIFDTGDPGFVGLPTEDWNVLTAALGATEDSSGQWWFPCQSTMSLNFKGNVGSTYTINLGDTTRQSNGLCAALANDAGVQADWIMGTQFMTNYYVIFHYLSNLMGLATKNVAANAATSAVLIGQS